MSQKKPQDLQQKLLNLIGHLAGKDLNKSKKQAKGIPAPYYHKANEAVDLLEQLQKANNRQEELTAIKLKLEKENKRLKEEKQNLLNIKKPFLNASQKLIAATIHNFQLLYQGNYPKAFAEAPSLALKKIAKDIWEYSCLKKHVDFYLLHSKTNNVEDPSKPSEHYSMMVTQISNDAEFVERIHREYEQAFKQILSPRGEKVEFTFITESNRKFIETISESGNRILLKMVSTNQHKEVSSEMDDHQVLAWEQEMKTSNLTEAKKKKGPKTLTARPGKQYKRNVSYTPKDVSLQVVVASLEDRKQELEKQIRSMKKELVHIQKIIEESQIQDIKPLWVEQKTQISELFDTIELNVKIMINALKSQNNIKQSIFKEDLLRSCIFQPEVEYITPKENYVRDQQIIQTDGEAQYWRQKSQKYGQEIQKLKEQIQSLQNKIKQNLQIIKEFHTEAIQKQAEKTETENIIFKQVSRIREMQQENNQMRSSRSTLSVNTVYSHEFEHENNYPASAKQLVVEQANQILLLNKENRELKRQKEQLLEDLQEIKTLKDEQNIKFDLFHAKVKVKMAVKKKQIAELNATKQDLQKKVMQLQSKLIQKTQKRTEIEQQYNQLLQEQQKQGELLAEFNRVKSLDTEHVSLRKQQQMLKQQLNNQISKNKQTIEKNEKLQKQLTRLLEEKGRIIIQLQKVKEQASSLKIKEDVLQKQMSSLHADYEAKLKASFKQLREKEQQIIELKNALEKAAKENEIHQASLKATQENQNENKFVIRRQSISPEKQRFKITEHLFTAGELFQGGYEAQRHDLIRLIEQNLGDLQKTKLIYRFQPLNKVNFHKYIDGHINIIAIVKTIYGRIIAAYSEKCFQYGSTEKGNAFLMTLQSQKVYPIIPGMRGITYDEYFMIFGNSEMRIRQGQKKVFSNFGIRNSYFNSKGDKVDDFLGDTSREVEMLGYEIYELHFK